MPPRQETAPPGRERNRFGTGKGRRGCLLLQYEAHMALHARTPSLFLGWRALLPGRKPAGWHLRAKVALVTLTWLCLHEVSTLQQELPSLRQ